MDGDSWGWNGLCKSPFCRHFFLLLTTILCESDVGCNQMVIIKVLRWALDRDTEIG